MLIQGDQICLSVIIVNYNTCFLLKQCLISIYNTVKSFQFEVIVVDNNSVDNSVEMLKTEFPDVIVFPQNQNLGFARANNLGVKAAKAPYILLLNSDTILNEHCIDKMLDFLASNSQIAMVGPKVNLVDGNPQEKSFGELPSIKTVLCQSLFLNKIFKYSNYFKGIYAENQVDGCFIVGWVSGVCMLIRKNIFEQVTGFYEAFFMYAEDIDLCFRINSLGWKIYRNNILTIKHVCSGSVQSENDCRRYAIMQQRNYLVLLKKNLDYTSYTACHFINMFGLVIRLFVRSLITLSGRWTERNEVVITFFCLLDAMGLTKEFFVANRN